MKSLPKTRQIIHPINNWANFSAKSVFDSAGKHSKKVEKLLKKDQVADDFKKLFKIIFLFKITDFKAVYRAIDIENANLSVVQICLIILSSLVLINTDELGVTILLLTAWSSFFFKTRAFSEMRKTWLEENGKRQKNWTKNLQDNCCRRF